MPVELVDDVRLKELAREPARELFPAARRDGVMRPVVILLAFLPGLLVFWNPSLDEFTSQEGLRALDVSSGQTAWDWIATATQEPLSNRSSSKPLATLLMALALKLELLAPENRLLLSSYLSSVFLLLSLSALAKEVGGTRFSILVVLLACGHREFLALSNELPPASLPLAFAVWSFRGILKHQSEESSLLSWPLIVSSLALAACWLSGSEVAIGAWGVLCVQSLVGGCDIVSVSTQTDWRRWLWRTLTPIVRNIVSLLLVNTVALVIVSGWQFAFSDRLDVIELAKRSLAVSEVWPTESRGTLAAQFVLTISGMWLGLVLLGAIRLVIGLQQGVNEADDRGRWFLLSWLGVSGAAWWSTWGIHGGDVVNSGNWQNFVLLSLLFLSAWGMEGVLLRRFGLASVLTALVVMIRGVAIPFWLSRMTTLGGGQSLTIGWLPVAGVILAGVWLVRRFAITEPRYRAALVACVTLMIVSDIIYGLRSRPLLSDDERELRAFRRQLVQGSPPNMCWLVSDERPPARLRFFLRSLWPNGDFAEARGEELVSAQPRKEPESSRVPGTDAVQNESRGLSTMIVTWGSPRLPTEGWRRSGQMLTQSATPHFLQGRPLKAYRWTLRSSPAREQVNRATP
jgi:hypothetical protein